MARVGQRVQLVRCADEDTLLLPGQRGTVGFIDDWGTVHINWDDGHRLGLIPGVDHWVEVLGGDYDEACRLAATDQELDPVIEALTEAGIDHYIDQTGGFCMLVRVGPADGYHLGITSAGEWAGGPPGTYLVCEYHSAEDEGEVLSEAMTIEELLDQIEEAYEAGRDQSCTECQNGRHDECLHTLDGDPLSDPCECPTHGGENQ